MENDFEMNKYDSDPADCNGYRTGSDVNTESADEFAPHPSEFGSRDKTQNEQSVSDETADVFNAPGIIAPLGNGERTDLGSLYDTQADSESATDNDCGCGDDGDCRTSRHGCGCGCGHDGGDGETSEEFSPSPEDETAATSDELYNNSTTNARKKCELDEYEIISDVLGGEKQLVKLYSTALCESAEESLRGVIRDNLIECAKDQYSTFEYMQKRGLYKTEQAPEDKIAQAKQQFRPITCFGDCDK